MTSPIPAGRRDATVRAGGRELRLTNLNKVFFPGRSAHRRYTKGDLLRYYAAVAEHLLPHLRGRAMVMKRYPNGIEGKRRGGFRLDALLAEAG